VKLFDSHCHLDDRGYKNDIDAVIMRAVEAEVAAVMTVGTNLESSRQAVRLADPRSGCYASVGIHPHDAKKCNDKALEALRELAANAKVRAWGEIGLDFNRMYSPRPEQEKWFIKQLEIADQLSLPIIFHERDSQGRFLEILKMHPAKGRTGVVHCFSGDQSELMQYLELGFYIGITGILTLATRGAKLRELAPLIPQNRILIETDAPYLTPAPQKNRTRRNEPAFVKSVLIKLAHVRQEDPEALAGAIWENTCRLYRIEGAA
jgi:TatD DNase family protein